MPTQLKLKITATRIRRAIVFALDVAEVVLMLSAVTICLMMVVKAGNYASSAANQTAAPPRYGLITPLP